MMKEAPSVRYLRFSPLRPSGSKALVWCKGKLSVQYIQFRCFSLPSLFSGSPYSHESGAVIRIAALFLYSGASSLALHIRLVVAF